MRKLVITTALCSLLGSSCGMREDNGKAGRVVAGAMSDRYKYQYCGILSIKRGTVFLEVNRSTKYALYPTNEDAKAQLDELPENRQGCVYGSRPPGSSFNNADPHEIAFMVENFSSGVDKNNDCQCMKIYSPVCDSHTNTTYSNSCEASCAGVYKTQIGPCYK